MFKKVLLLVLVASIFCEEVANDDTELIRCVTNEVNQYADTLIELTKAVAAEDWIQILTLGYPLVEPIKAVYNKCYVKEVTLQRDIWSGIACIAEKCPNIKKQCGKDMFC